MDNKDNKDNKDELKALKEQFARYWIDEIAEDHYNSDDYDMAWQAYEAGYKQACDDFYQVGNSLI